jgi:anion-transporting  ArsA/GET3 family ATPase
VDRPDWLAQTQVLFVIGKGGVGKTTVAATVALAAAQLGRLVELVELEGRPELAACFDVDVALTHSPVTLADLPGGGRVRARRIAPDTSLTEWLGDHGFSRLVPRLVRTGALDIIATAVPGIREVLVLGKIKAIARDTECLVVVDAPATGHSLSLLTAPRALVGAARTGPIRRQAEEVDALLRDASKTAVLLTTLPADLPVAEAIESADDLRERAGVTIAAAVLNRFDADRSQLRTTLVDGEAATLSASLLADVERARQFTLAVWDEQVRQRDRLATALGLPLVTVATLDGDHIGPLELEALTGAFGEPANS